MVSHLNLRQFRQEFVGSALATVTFDVVQGCFVPLLGMGGTGIGDQRNQITQIAGVPNRRADALICQQATGNQKVDTEIAQNIVNVGGDENT